MAYQIAFDMYESATQQFLSRVLAAIKKTAPEKPAAETPAEEMETAEEGEAKKEEEEKGEEGGELQGRVGKLASILSGEKPIYLHLQFLIRNDKTDPLILKNTKVMATYNLYLFIFYFFHHVTNWRLFMNALFLAG